MANYKRDGVELEIPDNALSFVKGWLDKADEQVSNLNRANEQIKVSYENSIAQKQDEIAAAQKEIETLKATQDALKSEIELIKKDAIASLHNGILERRKIEKIAIASGVLKEDTLDDFSTREIKEKVIADRWGKEVFKDRSEDALDAIFDIAAKEILSKKVTSSSFEAQKKELNSLSNDGMDHNNVLDALFKQQKEQQQKNWTLFAGGGK